MCSHFWTFITSINYINSFHKSLVHLVLHEDLLLKLFVCPLEDGYLWPKHVGHKIILSIYYNFLLFVEF
jgi:hypothetical protein